LKTRKIFNNATKKERNEKSGEGYFPGRFSIHISRVIKDFLMIIMSSIGTQDERAYFAELLIMYVTSG
jgi:hypothetical protein